MKDIGRQILGHIDEQTNIEYLGGVEYGLKIGENINKSERRECCDYIKDRVNKLNGDCLPHFEHDC